MGIAIPEEYGGGGRGLLEASVILEEVAASGAAMNGCSAIHLSIFGMHPLVLHGSSDGRAPW
ncbi:acyl-CoA dehydrogenase family protein [Streptomyces phaeochromogenes]|uniref:acyl-CoA dehydrogenase family protein n=1 Tax=Streptomyces phaeochromogenes TaxID=1923 RepID=UPI0036CC39B7